MGKSKGLGGGGGGGGGRAASGMGGGAVPVERKLQVFRRKHDKEMV